MNVQSITFELSQNTVKLLEKSTRCSIEELRSLPISETKTLMMKRGAVKSTNKIKQFFVDKYKKIGENLGLLNKEYNFYTHVD